MMEHVETQQRGHNVKPLLLFIPLIEYKNPKTINTQPPNNGMHLTPLRGPRSEAFCDVNLCRR